MIKIIALLRRRQDLTREAFDQHWREAHPRYVRALPGLIRYMQSPAMEHRREWPYDGLSELWFESVRDIAVAFSTPAADEMRDDERRFIGDMQWFLVDESGVREVALQEDLPTQTG
jgi:uncharacterized protein (TIGR02118 family)